MKSRCFFLLFAMCLSFLFCISCTSIVTQSNDDEQGKLSLLTKSSVFSQGGLKDIKFLVKESDVLNYIDRQADSQRILSLDPVRRKEDTLLYVVNYENDGEEIKAYACQLYKSVTRTIKSI